MPSHLEEIYSEAVTWGKQLRKRLEYDTETSRGLKLDPCLSKRRTHSHMNLVKTTMLLHRYAHLKRSRVSREQHLTTSSGRGEACGSSVISHNGGNVARSGLSSELPVSSGSIRSISGIRCACHRWPLVNNMERKTASEGLPHFHRQLHLRYRSLVQRQSMPRMNRHRASQSARLPTQQLWFPFLWLASLKQWVQLSWFFIKILFSQLQKWFWAYFKVQKATTFQSVAKTDRALHSSNVLRFHLIGNKNSICVELSINQQWKTKQLRKTS